MLTDPEITTLLKESKTIAVVGLSNNPTRASLGVARFLKWQGYRVIPVNPNEKEVLGERAYATIKEIPDPIDIVNVFRRSSAVSDVVEDALQKPGIRLIWMQEGVRDDDAAGRAEAANVPTIMDRCILKELARLL